MDTIHLEVIFSIRIHKRKPFWISGQNRTLILNIQQRLFVAHPARLHNKIIGSGFSDISKNTFRIVGHQRRDRLTPRIEKKSWMVETDEQAVLCRFSLYPALSRRIRVVLSLNQPSGGHGVLSAKNIARKK